MSKANRVPALAHDDGSGTLTSPRIERLRELYAQLEDPAAQERRTDAELNTICDEVYTISDDINASPAPGLLGIVEHAMAVQYWYRPHGSCAGEDSGLDVDCVQALVKAVLDLADGGVNG